MKKFEWRTGVPCLSRRAHHHFSLMHYSNVYRMFTRSLETEDYVCSGGIHNIKRNLNVHNHSVFQKGYYLYAFSHVNKMIKNNKPGQPPIEQRRGRFRSIHE